MSNTDDIILRAKDIRLSYKGKRQLLEKFEHIALDGVSFNLKQGENLGILGRNGCGKSSLLRILAGIIKPSSGEIVCDIGIRRSLLTLGLGFKPDLSGRDNALLSAMLQGASKRQALAILSAVQDFSELGEFFNQPVKTYSNGMRARLGFATAIESRVHILLIDETLSTGDSHFRQKAEKVMLEKVHGSQTVVFVSHNAEQINRICGRALWLEGGVIKYEGETAMATENYREFISAMNNKNNQMQISKSQ